MAQLADAAGLNPACCTVRIRPGVPRSQMLRRLVKRTARLPPFRENGSECDQKIVLSNTLDCFLVTFFLTSAYVRGIICLLQQNGVAGDCTVVISAEIKREALRLRQEQQYSLNEIRDTLGVSKGTLSVLLRNHPLSQESLAGRRQKVAHYVPPQKPREPEGKWWKTIKKHCDGDASKKGRIAEAAVLFRISLYGASAYCSPFDGDKADWIVDVPGQKFPRKVQVRCAYQGPHGLPYIRLRCSDGRSKYKRLHEDDFCYLVGYDLYSGTAYVFTADELRQHKATITVDNASAEAWWKMFGSTG